MHNFAARAGADMCNVALRVEYALDALIGRSREESEITGRQHGHCFKCVALHMPCAAVTVLVLCLD